MTEKIPQRFNIVETMAPVQRKYLDRLIRELEEIAGSRGKEEIFSSKDLNLIKRYLEKISEISLFLKERRGNSVEKDRELLIEWAREELKESEPERMIDDTFDFSEWPRIKTFQDLLSLSGRNPHYLPSGLDLVRLNIEDCPIKALPSDIKISHSLEANFSGLEKLPKALDLKILEIAGCPIKELPLDIKVLKVLVASNSFLEKLPEGLNLETVYLINCPIKELPVNIKISYLLNVCYSKLEKLPEGLNLGELYLGGSQVQELPDDLFVSVIQIQGCSEKIKQKAKKLKALGQIQTILE